MAGSSTNSISSSSNSSYSSLEFEEESNGETSKRKKSSRVSLQELFHRLEPQEFRKSLTLRHSLEIPLLPEGSGSEQVTSWKKGEKPKSNKNSGMLAFLKRKVKPQSPPQRASTISLASNRPIQSSQQVSLKQMSPKQILIAIQNLCQWMLFKSTQKIWLGDCCLCKLSPYHLINDATKKLETGTPLTEEEKKYAYVILNRLLKDFCDSITRQKSIIETSPSITEEAKASWKAKEKRRHEDFAEYLLNNHPEIIQAVYTIFFTLMETKLNWQCEAQDESLCYEIFEFYVKKTTSSSPA